MKEPIIQKKWFVVGDIPKHCNQNLFIKELSNYFFGEVFLPDFLSEDLGLDFAIRVTSILKGEVLTFKYQ